MSTGTMSHNSQKRLTPWQLVDFFTIDFPPTLEHVEDADVLAAFQARQREEFAIHEVTSSSDGGFVVMYFIHRAIFFIKGNNLPNHFLIGVSVLQHNGNPSPINDIIRDKP